jgi:predicted glycoside hydrolase/deacetylase ChbG (UPF0249 family)
MRNTTLEKLGFRTSDRLAIIHADDLGMCHAANAAFWEDLAAGGVVCGSLMMPCSWVPEMAAWCREHPEADLGVHITLNSEYDGFRWRPLSTTDPKSGLIDDEGYMWRSVDALYQHMDPDAAVAEMRAQVEVALAMGVDVTHIDTHMGSVIHPHLLPAYIGLGVECGVPLMLPRVSERLLRQEGIDPALGKGLATVVDELAATGFPVLDYTCAVQELGDRLAAYRRLLATLPAGITHIRTHPSVPGCDIEAIASSAGDRIADYETFLRPEFRACAAEQGIHLIGYRSLRALLG